MSILAFGHSMPATVRTTPRPRCPLCEREGKQLHGPIRDRAHGIAGEWFIFSCSNCRIGWLDPRPVDEDLGRCYPGEYYTHHGEAKDLPRGEDQPGLRHYLRRLILASRYGYPPPRPELPLAQYLGRWLGALPPLRYRVAYRKDEAIPLWRPPGRLLDIGCGGGAFLQFARALGWEPYGLDPDPVAVEAARRCAGAQVWLGTLDDTELPEAHFDAVVSMHSIEHAADPRQFLDRALRPLRPGGFFYLQTPNLESLVHRLAGADWYALEPPRHLCLLTPTALRRLCEEAASWSFLRVGTIPRRARREQEHLLALRRTGNFHGEVQATAWDRIRIATWSAAEHFGNSWLHWGEEVEVRGIRT
jgi:SAM-dependent methyltransferase